MWHGFTRKCKHKSHFSGYSCFILESGTFFCVPVWCTLCSSLGMFLFCIRSYSHNYFILVCCCRRFIWNFIRVENEHIKRMNCKTPLDRSIDELQEYDEEESCEVWLRFNRRNGSLLWRLQFLGLVLGIGFAGRGLFKMKNNKINNKTVKPSQVLITWSDPVFRAYFGLNNSDLVLI